MATSMDAECSSDVILNVALHPFDWRTLGRRLISPMCVSDIDREEHDEQNKRERMLLTWLQQEGSKATYRCLVEALERLGNKATAEKVTRLVMQGEMWEGCDIGGTVSCNGQNKTSHVVL